MSDEGLAALVENTNHLRLGLRQHNRPLSLLHTELAGKTLHQWHTPENR